MNISKFNINNISKFRKTKLFKRGVAFALAVTAVGSLAGCGEKKPILSDTILESSVVATVDGEKEILRKFVPRRHVRYQQYENFTIHDHYENVITGEFLVTHQSCGDMYPFDSNEIEPQRYTEITDIKSITNYLTQEELQKAKGGDFTQEDAIMVIARIKNLPVENAEEKIR